MLSLIISIIFAVIKLITTEVIIERDITTASIKKTHSQCQRGANAPYPDRSRKLLSSYLEIEAILDCAQRRRKIGGAYRDRTDDLMLAKQPLSQLS